MDTMLKIDGKKVNAELTEVFEAVFVPASASANISKRSEIAGLLAENLPALGNWQTAVIETEKETVTITNGENMITTLKGIVSAIALNEQYRKATELYEKQYDSIRESVAKNPSDGKRGRKSESVADKFAGAFTLE